MKFNRHARQILSLLLITASTGLFTGCGGNAAVGRSIHSISVYPDIPKPEKMDYSTRTSTSVGGAIAAGGGILPGVLAVGISHALTSRPRQDLEQAAAAHGVVIEQILSAAFANEIKNSGVFTLPTSGADDAAFHLDITAYGIVAAGGMFNGNVAPFVTFKVWLVKSSNGKIVYKFMRTGMADESTWHHPYDYQDNPELLRQGWQDASAAAAKAVMADMKDFFNLDNTH